jgi:transcriptional regulator with GAF, ATPase, and Fis domain
VPHVAAKTDPAQSDASNFVTDNEMKLQQRDNMHRALEYVGWRISGEGGAADLLGLKPSTLKDRMRAYGLEKPAVSVVSKAQ